MRSGGGSRQEVACESAGLRAGAPQELSRAEAREDGQQVDVGRSRLEQRHQQQEGAQVLDLANQPWQVEPEKQQVDEVELGKQRVDQQQESKQESKKEEGDQQQQQQEVQWLQRQQMP